MIAIIDYKAGNLMSVSNALNRLGANFEITSEIARLDASDAIIFPGVGHARAAMQALEERGLTDWLRQTEKPVLGICLGMQLLYTSTEEGDASGLGIIPGRLKRFDETRVKVPHLGWNDFASVESHPLLAGLQPENQMYYVHSYYAPDSEYALATCEYQIPFTSVCAKENFLGVQFHPEKSGVNGQRLLQNFLNMVQMGT